MKRVSILLIGTDNSQGLAPVQVDDHDCGLIPVSDGGGEPECQSKGREGPISTSRLEGDSKGLLHTWEAEYS